MGIACRCITFYFCTRKKGRFFGHETSVFYDTNYLIIIIYYESKCREV